MNKYTIFIAQVCAVLLALIVTALRVRPEYCLDDFRT